MPTSSSAPATTNQNLLGLVAYLGAFITGILLLLIEKQNKYVRFHAMQSTLTFGGLFILNLILGMVPFLGWSLGMILSIVGFILWVFLMYKAYSGEMYKLPYIGEIAEKQVAKLG